jgi:hypothetical protein
MVLRQKLLKSPDVIDFVDNFWNINYDDGDLLQYRRLANTWKLREKGLSFKAIGQQLQLDQRKACGLVSGYNNHPYLAQMYLNAQKLGQPRSRWKWILDCTPKPTVPYPKELQVPELIRGFHDILEFLNQFQPVPEDSDALRFFALTSAWAKEHNAELFCFLLAFLVGDSGKYYSEYVPNARHYQKTAMNTLMKERQSNHRVLRYVQLAMETVGIHSQQVRSDPSLVRWHSEASDVLTWMMRVCIGLKEAQRTSTHRVNMDWLKSCPRNLIIAFLQGLADSDGNVVKHGYYADISSVPNTGLYKELLDILEIDSHQYPKERPKQIRILLQFAVNLPLFNPIIRSYKYEQLIQHSVTRKLIPPPPSFFHLRKFGLKSWSSYSSQH